VNYRLINRGIRPENILGSIYCPHNVRTAAYLWLVKENVTMVVYHGDVQTIFTDVQSPPFRYLDDSLGVPIYGVNQTELKIILNLMGD